MVASVVPQPLRDTLLGILDAAVLLAGSDFGNVQVVDADNRLRIAVQRAFPDWWVEYWDERAGAGHGACGAAQAGAVRVLIEDVRESPLFTDPADLDSLLKLGIRAVHSTPILSRAGQLLGIFSTHHRRPRRYDDRTLALFDLFARQAAMAIEHALAEQSLLQLAVQHEAVVQNAPVGIVHVDPATLAVLAANPAFCAMLGYGEQEITGRHIVDDLTHPDDRAGGWTGLSQLAAGDIPHYKPVKRYLCRDGSTVWGQLEVMHLPGAAGGPGLNIAVVKDLSAQRASDERVREHLEQVFRLQRVQTANELAGVLAHEISQPLAGIPLFVGLARRLLAGAAIDRPALGEALDNIHRLSAQIGEIIRQMRRFYARGSIDPRPVDLNEVVVQVLALLEVTARPLNVRLVAELAADRPVVPGVDVHLEQVLVNLLRNACDAIAGQGPDGGTVTVRTRVIDGLARVTVIDTGPGIDVRRAGQLFDPHGSDRPGSLGMGLRISRSLVEAHGGRLWVEPREPGAVFHFEVPLT